MKRREFLLGTGASVGAVSAGTSFQVLKADAAGQAEAQAGACRTVFAGANFGSWPAEVARRQANQLSVEVLTWAPVGAPLQVAETGLPCQVVDGDKPDGFQKALSDREVLVFTLPEESVLTSEARVEEATRRVYHLLQGAVAAGVKSCIVVSTLRMFEPYDADFLVDEDWQPRPLDHDYGLAEYLAEFTCREFARERLLRVLVLRFGRIVDEVPPLAEARRIGWVVREDAIRALNAAVALAAGPKRETLRWWMCLHIGGKCPPSRFPTARAERLLGYRPSDI